MKRNTIHVSGCCLIAAALTLLASCDDDNNLFKQNGDLSALAFSTSVPGLTNGDATPAKTVYHVMDAIDVEGDSLYLVYTVSDIDATATQPTGSRGAATTTTNLESLYGSFAVSAFLGGDVTKPLREADEDGNNIYGGYTFEDVVYTPYKEDGTQVVKDDAGLWEEHATTSSGGGFYWPKNGSLAFYAYAPTSSSNTLTWSGLDSDDYRADAKIVFDYTVPTGITNSSSQRIDAEGQPDILVGSIPAIARSDSRIGEYKKSDDDKFALVPLTFYHPLCQVSFKANNNSTTDGMLKTDIVLNAITLSHLKGSGTCTFNPATTGKSADKMTWDLTDVASTASYTQSYIFDNTAGTVRDTIGTDAQHFMLIPQSLGGPTTGGTVSDAPNATVSIAYTNKTSGTKKSASFDMHKTTAYEWQAGKHYVYILTGDLTALTLDGSVVSWDTEDAKLPIRHYMLNVTKKELTFDDLFAEQTRTFDVLSYYYTGDTDDGSTRTAVNCKVEYEDADGNWQELGATSFGYTSAPYLGSADDAGATPAYRSLSHLYDATLDDALTEGTGMTFALSADRGTDAAGLLESANLSELVFTDDATVADGWDLSKCGVGGEYSSSNSRNTANCYIVKHPGSYTFPLVYGNAIQNGSTNASAYSTTLTSATTYTAAVLQNFVNFAGLKVGYKYQTEKAKVAGVDTYRIKTQEADKDRPGYILSNINGMQLGYFGFGIGQTGKPDEKSVTTYQDADNKHGIPAMFTYLKATLLWQDEAGMISNVQLVPSGKDENARLTGSYISFETAGASTLKQCNALIGLYVDADADGVLDAGEPIIWSWHIWVTNADLSDDAATMVSRTSTLPTNTNGMSIDYSGNYTFMPRDLGECDMNGAYLKTLKSSYAWLDGMNLRISQVEGDAKPQIITIHQPGKEIHPKPYAPLYQWGRKDPFGGWNLSTSATRVLYDEDGTAVSTSSTITGGHYSTDADRVNSIAQTIKRPLEMRVISTTTPTSSSYTLYYNCWNNGLNDGLALSSSSVSFTYPISSVKTIYDPCPYGYRVPDERAYLAFDPSNTWQINTGAIRYGTSTFVAVAKTSIPNDAIALLDANGAENESMVFPGYRTKNQDGSSYYSAAASRQTSSIQSNTCPLSLVVLAPGATSGFLQTTSSLYGRAVRPIRE